MADRYLSFTGTAPGRLLTRRPGPACGAVDGQAVRDCGQSPLGAS